MGGGGRKKREETFWNNAAKQANQQITQVDPIEQKFRQKVSDRLDWEKGTRDIADPRAGLTDYIQIGQAAKERAKRERMGTGALQLGEAGNSGYLANLKQLHQNEAAQDFGIGLENANTMAHAEATGSVLPLAQMTTNRNVAQAGHAGSMFGQWSNKQQKSWWDYLKEGVGMATGIGGMVFGSNGIRGGGGS